MRSLEPAHRTTRAAKGRAPTGAPTMGARAVAAASSWQRRRRRGDRDGGDDNGGAAVLSSRPRYLAFVRADGRCGLGTSAEFGAVSIHFKATTAHTWLAGTRACVAAATTGATRRASLLPAQVPRRGAGGSARQPTRQEPEVWIACATVAALLAALAHPI